MLIFGTWFTRIDHKWSRIALLRLYLHAVFNMNMLLLMFDAKTKKAAEDARHECLRSTAVPCSLEGPAANDAPIPRSPTDVPKHAHGRAYDCQQ